MISQGAEWWGGRLGDGSLVVLSPSGEALMLGDTSTPSGLQPGAKEASSGLRGWLRARSRVPFPYEGRHTIGLRHGTILVALALLVSLTVALRWLAEELTGIEPSGTAGGLMGLAVGTVACILTLALVYALEVLPLKRKGVRFVQADEDIEPYLRYVHSAVSATPEWESLTEVAREHSPPSEKASDIHRLLWDAAEIKPTLDASQVLPDDSARLSEMALLARAL